MVKDMTDRHLTNTIKMLFRTSLEDLPVYGDLIEEASKRKLDITDVRKRTTYDLPEENSRSAVYQSVWDESGLPDPNCLEPGSFVFCRQDNSTYFLTSTGVWCRVQNPLESVDKEMQEWLEEDSVEPQPPQPQPVKVKPNPVKPKKQAEPVDLLTPRTRKLTL